MLVQRNLQQLGGAGASFRPCCRHYPAQRQGIFLCSLHPAVSAFPERVVGSACTSSFSRIAQRSLALRPAHSRGHLYVTCYTEGSSHFVTSMTAPVASGWSGCQVGLSPTRKRRLLTAHTSNGHCARDDGCRNCGISAIGKGIVDAPITNAGRPRWRP